MLLAQDAKVMAKVISAAVKGAYKISTRVPWIFPIIIDDEECEKACCIIADIHISPGVRKTIKGKSKTRPLSFPIASERTRRNSKDVISGENMVCIQTLKKRLHSLSHK